MPKRAYQHTQAAFRRSTASLRRLSVDAINISTVNNADGEATDAPDLSVLPPTPASSQEEPIERGRPERPSKAWCRHGEEEAVRDISSSFSAIVSDGRPVVS